MKTLPTLTDIFKPKLICQIWRQHSLSFPVFFFFFFFFFFFHVRFTIFSLVPTTVKNCIAFWKYFFIKSWIPDSIYMYNFPNKQLKKKIQFHFHCPWYADEQNRVDHHRAQKHVINYPNKPQKLSFSPPPSPPLNDMTLHFYILFWNFYYTALEVPIRPGKPLALKFSLWVPVTPTEEITLQHPKCTSMIYF